MRRASILALAIGAAGFSACHGGGSQQEGTLTRAQLLDPQSCAGCHAEQFNDWAGSMHAYSSQDPVMRAMNARGQRETNGQLGKFCVNCHAPVAVREGATTDGLNLDQLPPHLKGITCYFCHSVESVTGQRTSARRCVLAAARSEPGGIGHHVRRLPRYRQRARGGHRAHLQRVEELRLRPADHRVDLRGVSHAAEHHGQAGGERARGSAAPVALAYDARDRRGSHALPRYRQAEGAGAGAARHLAADSDLRAAVREYRPAQPDRR
ncbi:MAG: hypothetical protein E6J58_00730 [Deltaproteobacteria bacterium]|nr:MAG: hypothetical protein E6J58_00730 [Deltaproteobacteria bacterium]